MPVASQDTHFNLESHVEAMQVACDFGCDAKQLEAKYETEHPTYTREDWRDEVERYDTLLGYWEWVLHQVESRYSDACDECGAALCDKHYVADHGYVCKQCADGHAPAAQQPVVKSHCQHGCGGCGSGSGCHSNSDTKTELPADPKQALTVHANGELGQIVVFASGGVTQSVALRRLPAGDDVQCIVVDYDDDENNSAEAFELKKLGVSLLEFNKTATYIG